MICNFIEDNYEYKNFESLIKSNIFNSVLEESAIEGIISSLNINIKSFFNSVIEKIRRIITALINLFKKIFGIQTKVKEITIDKKEKIIAILRITRNSHYINYINKEINNLLNIIPSIVRRSSPVDEINKDINLYMNHADDYLSEFRIVKNIPEVYTINVTIIQKNVNKLIDDFKIIYRKISSQSPNFDIKNDGPYSKLYIKVNNYLISIIKKINLLLLEALEVLNNSTSKSESKQLDLSNSKIIQSIEGYKVIDSNSKRLPFTKATNNKELINKYGEIFIVIDNSLFNLMSSKTKRFTLFHELNHCKQLDSGEDEKLSQIEREVTSDLYAIKKMNLSYNDTIKIFNELTDIAVKVGQPRSYISSQFNSRLLRLKKQI